MRPGSPACDLQFDFADADDDHNHDRDHGEQSRPSTAQTPTHGAFPARPSVEEHAESLIPQTEERMRAVAEDDRQNAVAISSNDPHPRPGAAQSRSDGGKAGKKRGRGSGAAPRVSEWSYQHMSAPAAQPGNGAANKAVDDDGDDDGEEEGEGADGGWRDMPALGELDYFDDTGHLVAKAGGAEEADEAVYRGLGGAGKGYTRIQHADDGDAASVTSLDDDTGYLFREPQSNALAIPDRPRRRSAHMAEKGASLRRESDDDNDDYDDHEEDHSNDDDDDDDGGGDDTGLRDPLSQLQTTKQLLTEAQRLAYVGLTRLTMHRMVERVKDTRPLFPRPVRRFHAEALDSLSKWGQTIMMRLYTHMDISAAEQLMIEQLSQHGVRPEDLVPTLMQSADVKNPMARSHSRSHSRRHSKMSVSSATTASSRTRTQSVVSATSATTAASGTKTLDGLKEQADGDGDADADADPGAGKIIRGLSN
ncbi:Transmembrane and coiled-coil domain-containing protein 4 [Ascosphaera acerosa]|nr:Transmembrane and coiled-coil domain-containing protein 4 [Ascosphaera acerosa]